MEKVIGDHIVHFYENGKEIMNIEHITDECIWFFYNAGTITITEDMELFKPLNKLMKQKYIFGNSIFNNYKTDNKIVWHSDIYCDPDNQYSVDNVAVLTIEKFDNCFKVSVTKPIFEYMNCGRYCAVIFSPAGNGQMTKNVKSGLSFQDDFVLYVFRELLLHKSKKLKK